MPCGDGEPDLPGKVSDAGATAKDNRLFWKRFSGGYAPGRHGVISHPPLAIGTASSGDFVGGPSRAYLRVFFKAMSGDPDLDLCARLTAPSFRFTRRQPAQRGTQAQAIAAAFPQAHVQTCIALHLPRHSMSFASDKDRKAVAVALKAVYTAVDAARRQWRRLMRFLRDSDQGMT